MKKRRINFNYIVGCGVTILSLLTIAFLLPITDLGSSALGENETMTAGLNTKTTAYLYSTITLSTSGQVDIDITPKAAGALGIGKAEVKVATNNTTGYSMFLSTVDQTNRLNQIDSNLQYQEGKDEYYIDTLPSSTTAKDYLASSQNLNTWGYALTSGEASGSTEYHGMKSPSGEQIYSTKGTSSNDSYNLNVAVAVDTTLPAGGYRNGLVVTAVANPIILSGFNQIYYMQEMTPAVCESAAMESTAQLVDKRDNKLYWVAKLKDGNCWMTQNLALDLSTEVALTPEDSDVSSSWMPSSSTNEVKFDGAAGDTARDKHYSWNIGKIILGTPLAIRSCENYGYGNSAKFSDNLATNCRTSGFVDVSGSEWSPTFTAQTGDFDGAKQTLVAVNETGKTYDAHYLVGNYYQFNTATAGRGVYTTEMNAVVSDSICPKGWMLPASGENDIYQPIINPNQNKASFYQLLVSYGYPETNDYIVDDENHSYTNILNPEINIESNLAAAPMHFVRAGNVTLYNGYLRFAGSSGISWSSTSASSLWGAFYFNLNEVVEPAYINARYVGGSVRCVAR